MAIDLDPGYLPDPPPDKDYEEDERERKLEQERLYEQEQSAHKKANEIGLLVVAFVALVVLSVLWPPAIGLFVLGGALLTALDLRDERSERPSLLTRLLTREWTIPRVYIIIAIILGCFLLFD